MDMTTPPATPPQHSHDVAGIVEPPESEHKSHCHDPPPDQVEIGTVDQWRWTTAIPEPFHAGSHGMSPPRRPSLLTQLICLA